MKKQFKVIFIVTVFLLIFTGTVSAYSNKTKNVFLIYNGETTSYRTAAETTEEFLDELDIELDENDYINADQNDAITDDTRLEIRTAFPVVVYLDGVPRLIETSATNLDEFLKSIDSALGGISYIMEVGPMDGILAPNMEIRLTSAITESYTKLEDIEYQTEYKDDPNMPAGIETIITPGVLGQVEVTMEESYVGDLKISSEEVSRKVISEPQTAVIARGTMTSIDNLKFKKAINVVATAYTPYDPGCNGITATGTKAGPGVIAVDTDVISFGTRVYIPGYGIGVAEDTGGAIVGNRIDVCYNTVTEAYKWGVKNVTIYVLE